MSASTAAARAPRTSLRRTPDLAGRLRVVAAPVATARRLPFVGVCVALLVASLLAVLVVNIALSRGAYDVHLLEQRRTELREREQQLSEQLAIDSSPARLSERARALGMIPASSPAFIRLSDGAVLGSPAPADPALAAAVAAIPTAVDLAAARALGEQATAEQAATEAARLADDPAAAAAVTMAAAAAAASLTGTDPPTGAGSTGSPPPESAAAEQAALDAARAAAAATAPPAPLGDGAVATGSAP